MLYGLAARHLNKQVARVAALLLAVSPWGVLGSRGLAETAFLMPTAVLLLQCLVWAIAEQRPWGWFGVAVALGLALGTTLQAIPLLIVCLLLMLLFHHRVSWVHLLLGVALVALIAAPYLSHQNAVRLGDLRAMLRGLVSGWAQPQAALITLRRLVARHAGLQLVALTAPSQSAYSVGMLNAFSRLAGLGFLIACPTVLVLAVRRWGDWRQARNAAPEAITATWLWVMLLLSTGSQSASQFEATAALVLPVGLLSLAITFDALIAAVRKGATSRRWWLQVAQLGFLALGLGLVLSQAYAVVNFYGFVSDHDTSLGFGTPFRFWRRTANLIQRESKAEGLSQIWILARPAGPSLEPLVPALGYLLEPEVTAIALGADGSDSLLLPTGHVALYLLTDGSPRAEDMVRQLGGSERGRVLFPDEKARARVMFLEERTVEEILALVQRRGLWALDNGLRLLGYDWPPQASPGSVVEVATWWTFLNVSAEDREAEHVVFVQLITAEGLIVAEGQAFGLEEHDWEQGQLLKQWCALELPESLPPGDYYLTVGSYRPHDAYRNRYLDDLGHTLGQAIPLGPVRVGALP
jgi:4-amino-4-deoxy-L-arabinose transferase-like glycosyltransferase